jgi:hypothetical protein
MIVVLVCVSVFTTMIMRVRMRCPIVRMSHLRIEAIIAQAGQVIDKVDAHLMHENEVPDSRIGVIDGVKRKWRWQS